MSQLEAPFAKVIKKRCYEELSKEEQEKVRRGMGAM
jgi:hypothetical protein